jgi:alpha-galactosidase
MLEVGNGHMTDDEYRTHMSLWALAAAPLLAGNDVRTMSASTKSILLNSEVIAVDQDPLGKQSSRIKKRDFEIWVKPLADGSVAVGAVNLGSASIQVENARDLWEHREVHFSRNAYSATVPAHGVLLLKVSAS